MRAQQPEVEHGFSYGQSHEKIGFLSILFMIVLSIPALIGFGLQSIKNKVRK